ncbi:TAXI family TRAP transporter solute-binding subunit [Petroclostridium sp. X23]|uniref:TAXI family TRAP transporter solute-binding subunit n=1 Tax=Petroclostridium sp. X23 TaxID=3045146 RepID=UPI0024ACFFF8|nr:TAXI family TRAP transporter solute-binding subunit [Petroclostridium sp. X23]WHH61198.1 TAXI family TRAP transporter solute-binding subunit [Petroclostridium sp. X23]
MMKRKLAFLLSIVLTLAIFAGCSKNDPAGDSASGDAGKKPAKRQFMTFAAPPASSAVYPYWVAVGKAISTVHPEFQITVSESQGAVDITKRVRSGEVAVGNSVSSTDYENYSGTGSFEGQANKEARMLWYHQITPEHFVVSKDSGVKSLSDLNGKKFNPGGTGTSAAAITFSIMDILGVKPDYFEAGQSDAADAYANRQIIGTVKLGPVNDSYVMQLVAAQPINIISLSDEEIKKVNERYPYMIDFTIPAGTYQGVDEDVRTMATMQGAQTTSKLSQEDGYKMVKAMCEEGKEIWASAYAQGADTDILELALKSPIPLHAGTVQYLKEKGYDVPEKLTPPEYKQ